MEVWGIPYTQSNVPPPLPADYGAMVKRVLGDLDCEIEIEPGRLIVGNAGVSGIRGDLRQIW